MTFEINEKQKKQIDKWLRSIHKRKGKGRYYGREVSYTFSHASGIGVSLMATDLGTGETKDFTDYDTW